MRLSIRPLPCKSGFYLSFRISPHMASFLISVDLIAIFQLVNFSYFLGKVLLLYKSYKSFIKSASNPCEISILQILAIELDFMSGTVRNLHDGIRILDNNLGRRRQDWRNILQLFVRDFESFLKKSEKSGVFGERLTGCWLLICWTNIQIAKKLLS